MHTFFVDDLIQLYCLLRVSNNHVFVLRKTCTVHAVYMVLLSCIHMGQSDIDETAPYGCMKVIPYKLHEQVFLRMNTWLFETCRRQYNLIKLSMKKCAFCLFLLHRYITTHGSKTVKFSYLFIYLFIYLFMQIDILSLIFLVSQIFLGTAVAQWLRCCTTNRMGAGSIPTGVNGFLFT